MSKLLIKGGYGEHGRCCFMITKDSYYIMLDCGILDTDPQPYPNISKEQVKNIKYLVITHCHKDHMGAFSYLLNLGFEGTVITTKATYELAQMEYSDILWVDRFPSYIMVDGVEFYFGRSGHCPGAIWVAIKTKEKSFFYSGDYQENAEAYVCDKVRGFTCDLGIVDLAHKNKGSVMTRKNAFEQCVKECLYHKKKVILPVQQYGRGIEILVHLLEFVEKKEIAMDTNFCSCLDKTLEYPEYVTKSCREKIVEFRKSDCKQCEGNIVLLGDTHIENESTKNFIENQRNSIIIVTGRVKKGGYIEALLAQKKAEKKTYIHHQSKEDMEQLLQENNIKVVIPFHNNEKEVIIN